MFNFDYSVEMIYGMFIESLHELLPHRVRALFSFDFLCSHIFSVNLKLIINNHNNNNDHDELFLRMVDRRKALSLISSRGHSPSFVFNGVHFQGEL